MPGLAEADKPRKRVVYALSNPYNAGQGSRRARANCANRANWRGAAAITHECIVYRSFVRRLRGWVSIENVEKLAKEDRFCKKKNFVRKGACYSICIYICVSFYKIKIRNLGLCLGITVAFKIFCVNIFTRSSVKHNLSYSVGYKRKIEIVQNHKFLFIAVLI